MAANIYPLRVSQELDIVRDDSIDVLLKKFDILQCNTGNKAPLDYILSLAESEQIVAFKLCILVYYVTAGKEVPKQLQLQATLHSIEHDSLVVAGTVTQVQTFLLKYQIDTISINHDTPKTKEFWREHIHDSQKHASQSGTAQHLIVTAEQIFKSSEGHLSRFTLLLCEHSFSQRIAHNPFPANGSLRDQPRVLMFFDNSSLACHTAKFLGQRIPQEFRGKSFVWHYSGLMSEQYLELVHQEFTDVNGPCRILCATLGESMLIHPKMNSTGVEVTVITLVVFILSSMGLGCSRYSNPFTLQDHLPGPISPVHGTKRKSLVDGSEDDREVSDEGNDEDEEEIEDNSHQKQKPEHRKALMECLLAWHSKEHQDDPLPIGIQNILWCQMKIFSVFDSTLF
ncbi:hypothetical protein BT96DRAFT_949900 [Gymnopus androsaceus JB14]|uniref:Uncharacterized protein n=1 Tax=Gymnopus androsaceus JB14 TaxID=1447944 RepID=A0A6A4GIH4_9AGAR|nr:hypothetical protein BT96DRAFT_949900 [Gymnopus androsaceus JB14]